MRTSIPIAAVVLALSVAVPATAGERVQPGDGTKGWLVSIADLSAIPPPAANRSELAEVKKGVASRTPADAERIRWWNAGGPAYRWNEIAVGATLDEFVTLPLAARHLALVHTAVDDAVSAAVAARRSHHRRAPYMADRSIVALGSASPSSYPSEHAAAAAAASDVLAYLYPKRADALRARADEAMRLRVVAGVEYPSDVGAGRDIGRRAAALAIAYGRSDGSDARWTGTMPEGTGKWNGTNPIAPAAAGWHAWTLARNDELRPPPPPAYDSDKGRADLAELKAYARTPRSNHRATYWEVFGGARAHVLWNEIARTKLLEYGDAFDSRSSARVLTMVNVALLDSAIACWDAKYAYWQMRPSQFDAELKTVFAPPNHPSYPAAHGCLSTAAASVLAGAFPRDRDALLAMGKEAAEARVWAGIHTRTDIDAGQEIGRQVAQKVLARGGWNAAQ